MFYQEGNTSSLASWTFVSDSIITWDFEIVLSAIKRFIWSNNIKYILF